VLSFGLNLNFSYCEIAYDESNLLLYVSLHQIFRIQFLPFHRSSVNLTTVLQLTRRSSSKHSSPLNPIPVDSHTLKLPPSHQQRILDSSKLYVASQTDLYQTNEFVKFVLPWLNLGELAVLAWQFMSTAICIILAVLFWPVTWVEQNIWGRNKGLWDWVRVNEERQAKISED
jgi:hypothetical protein